MAVVVELVIGGLTAVCTSLVVVLLLWRLSRHFSLRATPPPCCDVTDLLAWLLDACQTVMGAAILVLVVGDETTCAVAGFLALFGGAQTLCLIATRAVVMATGHVGKGGSRGMELNGGCDVSSKLDDKRCTGSWWILLLIIQILVVTVFCALPLSQLPVATTTTQPNHTAYHLTCLPLTLESRDTAAWRYSCFLLFVVGWLPLLVAGATGVIHYSCRTYTADRRKDCRPTCGSACLLWSSALRLILWTVIVVLVSVEVFSAASASRRAAVQIVLALCVDAAMLMHVVCDILYVRQCQTKPHHHHQQQKQHHQLPARLTVVTRTHQQLVR